MLRREQVLLERSLKRVLRRASVGSSFAPLAVLVAARVGESQARIADGGQAYTEALLGDSGGLSVSVAPLVGVTGAGVPVREVFEQSRVMSTQDSLRLGVAWALQLAHTALADVARQSTVLGMATRNAGGYARAVEGEACARCVVLAGRLYWTEEAFDRHPQCDCIHVPYSDDPPDGVVVNGDEYFESLTAEEQDRLFTKAGAEAIRAGANINQVVNARRGMNSVATVSGRRQIAPRDVFGQQIYTTSEGTTRRGFARVRLQQSFGNAEEKTAGVNFAGATRPRMRASAPRMMPESIVQQARRSGVTNYEAELKRLLRQHGYIL